MRAQRTPSRRGREDGWGSCMGRLRTGSAVVVTPARRPPRGFIPAPWNNFRPAASCMAKPPAARSMSVHAFDDQLSELLPRLRRFALWLTRDLSSADDLVQSTIERALSTRAAKRDDGDLRAWLFRILYRQFLDTRRRAQRYAWLLGRQIGRA